MRFSSSGSIPTTETCHNSSTRSACARTPRWRSCSWLPRNGAGGEGVDAHIHRLYRHPDLPGRLYAVTRTGLYRSTDEGHSWLQSLKDLDRSWGGSLAVLPGPTDTLVLSLAKSAEGAGALVSATGGVLMHGEAGVDALALEEQPAHGGAGSLGSHKDHIDVSRWDDAGLIFVNNAKAMGSYRRIRIRQ